MIPEALEAEIRGRVESVRARIEAAAARAGRSPEEVTLVGISKRQAPERVAAAVLAGVAHLGENYVQEARGKRAAVEDLLRGRGAPAPCWHMVGGLQRNKARDSVQIFRVIETVDRAPLAVELDRRAGAASAVIHVLLQVNLSGEDQKGGTEPGALPALLEACAGLARLRVRGLMTVPAASPDPEEARAAFARLRELRDSLADAPGGQSLRELSMGMSADFETAVEEGATSVRVGTDLFGPRE